MADIDDFFVNALGSAASAPPRAIKNSRKRACMRVRAFSLTPDVKLSTNEKAPRNAQMLVFQPMSDAVLELQNDEDCSWVDAAHSKLRVCAYEIDKADQEAKRGQMQAVNRLPAGEVVFEMGTVLEVQWGKDVKDSANSMSGMLAGRVYELTISEVRRDTWEEVTMTRCSLSSYVMQHALYEMSAADQELLMAASLLAMQTGSPLTHLVLDGPVPASDDLKKLKSKAFTESTRAMKMRQHLVPLMNLRGSPGSKARVQRHLQTVRIKENPLSTTLTDLWPREVKDKDGNITLVEVLQFSVQGHQFTPQGTPAALPVQPDEVARFFKTDELGIAVTGYSSVYDNYWMCDRRYVFNQGAGRVLVANTPAAFVCYLKNESVVSSSRVHSKKSIDLLMGVTGKKDEPTSTAGLTFLAHGVVNAGYPIDKQSALRLMDALHAREKMRFNRNMLAAPKRLAYPPGSPLKIYEHPLRDVPLDDNVWVINAMESNVNLEEVDTTRYECVVVTNVAEKGEAPLTAGMSYLRTLLATHTPDEARAQLGEVMVQLATANGHVQTPADAVDVFRTNGSFQPQVMLWLVGKQFMRDAQLDFCTVYNHERALERVFARLYPELPPADTRGAKRAAPADAEESASNRAATEQPAAKGEGAEDADTDQAPAVDEDELSDTELVALAGADGMHV